MLKHITIVVAVLGLAAAVWVVATAKEELPDPPPAQPPSVNPYDRGLAALGFVEPRARQIDVGAPEPGLVVEVYVEVNDRVKKGDRLLAMDDRPLRAELLNAQAARDSAAADLARIRAQPREEDIPALEAQVELAQAETDLAADMLRRVAEAREGQAASSEELTMRRYQLEGAKAALAHAKAELARTKAGAWGPEVAVAEAALAQAQAGVEAIELRLSRLTVAAPADGNILKRNIEPGEYISPAPTQPALVLGDLATLHVRAQVNEEDTPLLQEGAEAVARVRGPVDLQIPLRMLRIEPLAMPKTHITGSASELVDTRVVEVVFEVLQDPGQRVRLYPGQAVDVFINASP